MTRGKGDEGEVTRGKGDEGVGGGGGGCLQNNSR